MIDYSLPDTRRSSLLEPGDVAANGPFNTLAGTAASGVTGLTLTTPPDDIAFYLLASRNVICGQGPKR